MTTTRWQDWLIMTIGIALIAAPFLLAAAMPDGTPFDAIIGFVVSGLVVTALGTFSLGNPEPWEEYLTALAGLWLMAMPWVLAFRGMDWLAGVSVAAGAALVALALLALRRIMADGQV